MRMTLAAICLLGSTAMVSAEPLEILDARLNRYPDSSGPSIVVRLSVAGGDVAERLTTENIGRQLSLKLDGREIMAPIIRAPISNRYLLLSGNNMTSVDAEKLAEEIRRIGLLDATIVAP